MPQWGEQQIPEEIEISDRVKIYSPGSGGWGIGWLTIFRQLKEVTFFSGVLITTTKIFSEPIYFAPFSTIQLLMKVPDIVIGFGEVITMNVEVSNNETAWYPVLLGGSSTANIQLYEHNGGQMIAAEMTAKGKYLRITAKCEYNLVSAGFDMDGVLFT